MTGSGAGEPMTASPNRLADSMVLAGFNYALTAVASWVTRLPQDAVPGWLWAACVAYAMTIGPVLLVALTGVIAFRDWRSGQRWQAMAAVCIGVLTFVRAGIYIEF